MSAHVNGTGLRPSTLSKRAQARLAAASCLSDAMNRIYACQYTVEDPHGPVSLGVAENALAHHELVELFNSSLALETADLTYGTALTGSKRLFAAFGKLFAERFHAVKPVLPEHMVSGSGVSALLDQLLSLLVDEGEGVALATPYYAGFSGVIKARNRAVTIDVHLSDLDPSSPETVRCFDDKFEQLKAAGGPVPRVVILCSPHNPLGFVYPRETVVAYMQLAQRWDLHLVCDEIYALSVYDPTRPFVSALSIDPKSVGCVPSRVHVLYGASKDFGVNGLRLGVFVSQANPPLLQAFVAAAIWLKASSAADALVSGLLNNAPKLDAYLTTNVSRMHEAYARMTSWLDQHRIPYVPAAAGHYLWADLRRFLPNDPARFADDAERETQLWLDLLDGGVYLAPGSFYSSPVHGHFRITFTVHPACLEEGLRRLERILGLGTRGQALGKRDSIRFADDLSLATLTEALKRADLQCC